MLRPTTAFVRGQLYRPARSMAGLAFSQRLALSRSVASSPFSTHAARWNKQQSDNPKAEPKEGASTNPQMPAFSFEGLGMGKKMKMFLVILVCIFGTMETWFYCKAIWMWWNNRKAKEAAES